MLGILTFGDSITHGGGELQWGVALQGWAHWVARALGLPYSSYAVDGADVRGVVGEQIPAFLARAQQPEGPYDLGCLYIGTNDVRGFGWDPVAFEAGLREALAFLAERCERVLTLTIPVDLGRPRAGAKVHELNAIVERSARASGALVVDLRGFRGRRVLMADHVHPTALGQVAIAERALGVLAAEGVPERAAPSALIAPGKMTRIGRLRGDATYAYRHAKVSARAGWIVLRVKAGRPPTPAAPGEPA